MAYNILIMGASYGSLLASKMLFGGHKIHHVCLPAEADASKPPGPEVSEVPRGPGRFHAPADQRDGLRQDVAAADPSDGRWADRSGVDPAGGVALSHAAVAAASRGVSQPGGGKRQQEGT